MSDAARRFRAVIFDMDGVLADSEPAFYEALNEVIAPAGKRIDWAQYQELLGTSTSTTWNRVRDMLSLDGDPKEYLDRYNVVLLDHLRKPRPPLPGVRGLLERLRAQHTPIGLATSSWEPWVHAVLGAAELPLECFDAIVWRQMAEKSKPAPDLYLKAAELLEIEPSACVAIEDTPVGIGSAQAAGMFAVQVRAASTAFPPIEDADLVLETLESFPIELIAHA
ncbi:MAG: HAD family phosphatase [Dehalococcoidia bacterium]